jgi:adenylylsulfate kinase
MEMTTRILIMGLPGAGKTYFAERLRDHLTKAEKTCSWFNADQVREHYNDWDFSREGRIRQSLRMRELADETNTDYCIVDFVAPLPEMRHNYKADWTIWMDTIDAGRYADTNKMFVEPDIYDFRISEQNADKWSEFVGNHILEDRCDQSKYILLVLRKFVNKWVLTHEDDYSVAVRLEKEYNDRKQSKNTG